MARIRPGWVPPEVDNNTTNDHPLGFDFSSDAPLTVTGLWWFQVAGVGAPTTVRAMLWHTASQTLKADSGSVSTFGFVQDDWNYVPFIDPFDTIAATMYTASISCTGKNRYDSTALNSPITDPSGHVTIPAGGGRFLTFVGDVFPSSTWNGMHGVDLEFGLFSGLWGWRYDLTIG